MKTVSDINNKYIDWVEDRAGTAEVVNYFFSALIGITEHLEAQDPCKEALAIARSGDARREAMIEALRWVNKNFHTWIKQESVIAAAITRLKNGGEL